MNAHVTYLVAQERTADLVRAAEQARAANPERESKATAEQRARADHPLARLWILVVGKERLRARRA
jgi:hypothetical protein